ncbi:hypothetical protein OROMI_007051 [Orobanche minor]
MRCFRRWIIQKLVADWVYRISPKALGIAFTKDTHLNPRTSKGNIAGRSHVKCMYSLIDPAIGVHDALIFTGYPMGVTEYCTNLRSSYTAVCLLGLDVIVYLEIFKRRKLYVRQQTARAVQLLDAKEGKTAMASRLIHVIVAAYVEHMGSGRRHVQ